MDDRTQGALLLAVGGISLRLGLTDAALTYVKPSLQPPLVLTGLVLGALGIAALVRSLRGGAAAVNAVATDDLATTDHAALHGMTSSFDEDEAVAEHAHDHAHGPAVAWLLVLPLLGLLLIAPPPLGAFAAGRQSNRPPVTEQTFFGGLPAEVNGAVPLGMTDYVFRALYDESRSLQDVRVRLSGFVTPNEDGDGYLLTRFTMNCCAADATAVTVEILGDQPRAADEWLEVEGYWQPRDGHEPGAALGTITDPPLLRADAVTPIEAPTQTYE